jgi:hypothetical protein
MRAVEKATYAQNRMAKSSQSNRKNMASVDDMVGNLRATMEQNLKVMEETDQAQQSNAISAEMWSKGLTAAGVALGAVGAASGALIFSSTKLAARVETLGVVTQRLGANVGLASDEVLELEGAIVDQGITLRSARESMALMVQANIDLAKGTELARLAQDAAVIANRDSSDAFRQLVWTISAGNVRMARQLGLQVSFEKAYKKMADTLEVTTDELSEQQRVQARTNAVIEAGARITGTYEAAMTTAGKKVLSLNRHIEESRRILGEAFLPVFADVVDKATELLKKWEELDEGQQAVVSNALGAATAFAIVGGAVLVLTGQLVGLAASATIAGAALTTVFAPLAVVGIFGALITAVVALNTAQIEHIKLLRETEKQFALTADSYEDYAKELENFAKEEDTHVITMQKYNELIERGGQAAYWARNAVVKHSEAWFNLQRDLEGGARFTEDAVTQTFYLTQHAIKAAKEERELADAERDAARAAEEQELAQKRLTKEINLHYQELQNILGLDLTGQYESMVEELERVDEQERNLKKQMGDVNERIAEYRKEIQKIKDEEGPLTEDQKDRIASYNKRIAEAQEQLGGLRGELNEIPEALEEVRQAWDRQTKQMIFDLTAQRLMLDGLTSEELAALGKLAGPQGFGLVDEASQRLIEGIGLAADKMDEQGDQSDILVDFLVDLQETIGDVETAVEDLGVALDDLPTETEVAVTLAVKGMPELRGKYIPEFDELMPQLRQGGGTLSGFDILGDRGPEMVIGNQIVPATQTRKYLDAISHLVRIPQELMASRQATYTPSPSYVTNNNVTNEGGNYNLHIHSSAPTENIVADFRMMKTLGSRV